MQAREWRHILPAFILLLAMFLPPEARITIADQTLYSYRIAYLLMMPWALSGILRGQLKFYWPDGLVLLGSGWMVVSFVVNSGVAAGLASGVGAALDVILPYLVVRMSVRNLRDFRRLLVLLAPVVFVISIVMIMESVTHTRYIRDAGQAIFGQLGAAEFGSGHGARIASDIRFGLLRAMGPFSHPILAGLFLASLLPLFYYLKIRGWPLAVGYFSGAVSVLTASSAAVLAIGFFVLTAAYEFVRRRVSFLTWGHFTGTLTGVLLFAHFATQNGIISVLVRYTLNPHSGYYRLLIWEYGSASVARNPLFGIGYRTIDSLWWMGDSIDAYWLALAIRYGLPTPIMIFLAMILILVALSRTAKRATGGDKTAIIGTVVTLVILGVCGFTVSYFGGIVMWFYAILAIGLNVAHAPLGAPQQARPRPPFPTSPLQARLRPRISAR